MKSLYFYIKHIKIKNKKIYIYLYIYEFGHTHEQIIEKTDINYICNPHGRPEDYDREDYSIYNLKLE